MEKERKEEEEEHTILAGRRMQIAKFFALRMINPECRCRFHVRWQRCRPGAGISDGAARSTCRFGQDQVHAARSCAAIGASLLIARSR